MQKRLKKLLLDSDSRGFTLIEVCIVMVILLLVVGLSIPNLKTWLSHSRVNADARNMLSAFQQARMEAVKRSEYCAVAFNQAVGGTTYDYVVFFDKNVSRAFEVDEKILLKADFDHATATSFFTNVAIFNSRGLPSDSATSINPVIGRVELDAEGYKRTVVVSRFGRIRID